MTRELKRNNPYYQAQDILSRRDHSEYELRQKLARKKFSPQQITEVIQRLKQERLVDDQIFAEKYIRATLSRTAVGQQWLKAKLRQKGVTTDTITEVLAQVFQDHDQVELVAQAAQRWQRIHPAHASDTTRLTRFLQSRGFSYQEIASYLERS